MFDDASPLHHRNAVRKLPDQGEVMRNENIGQAELGLQRQQNLDDIRLNADIESGCGFVQHDHIRFKDQRTGDCHTLTLPAGEGRWFALQEVLAQADIRESFPYPLGALFRRPDLEPVEWFTHKLPHLPCRVSDVNGFW